MDSSKSYYKDYIRRRDRGVLKEENVQHRGLTDRTAYMSFLEVQLERVSAACMTSEGFSDRIEQIQSQVMTMEKKISNLSSAIQLSQKYSEEGVKDVQNVSRELKNLKNMSERKFAEIEDAKSILAIGTQNDDPFASISTEPTKQTKSLPLLVEEAVKTSSRRASQAMYRRLQGNLTKAIAASGSEARKWMVSSTETLERAADQASESLAEVASLRERIEGFESTVLSAHSFASSSTSFGNKKSVSEDMLVDRVLTKVRAQVNNVVKNALSTLEQNLEQRVCSRVDALVERRVQDMLRRLGETEDKMKTMRNGLNDTESEKRESSSILLKRVESMGEETRKNTELCSKEISKMDTRIRQMEDVERRNGRSCNILMKRMGELELMFKETRESVSSQSMIASPPSSNNCLNLPVSPPEAERQRSSAFVDTFIEHEAEMVRAGPPGVMSPPSPPRSSFPPSKTALTTSDTSNQTKSENLPPGALRRVSALSERLSHVEGEPLIASSDVASSTTVSSTPTRSTKNERIFEAKIQGVSSSLSSLTKRIAEVEHKCNVVMRTQRENASSKISSELNSIDMKSELEDARSDRDKLREELDSLKRMDKMNRKRVERVAQQESQRIWELRASSLEEDIRRAEETSQQAKEACAGVASDALIHAKKRQQDILNALAAIDSQIPTLLAQFNDERIQPQFRRLHVKIEENGSRVLAMEQKISAISAETDNMSSQIALETMRRATNDSQDGTFVGLQKWVATKIGTIARDLQTCVETQANLETRSRVLEDEIEGFRDEIAEQFREAQESTTARLSQLVRMRVDNFLEDEQDVVEEEEESFVMPPSSEIINMSKKRKKKKSKRSSPRVVKPLDTKPIPAEEERTDNVQRSSSRNSRSPQRRLFPFSKSQERSSRLCPPLKRSVIPDEVLVRPSSSSPDRMRWKRTRGHH